MCNNLEIIISLLKFYSEDDFYFLQILRRKKEHPDLRSNSEVIKTYTITSKEHLIKKMPEIILLCDFYNARACINLNLRSFEKIAYQTLKKACDQVFNKDFKSLKNAFNSAAGTYSSDPNKKWILDIDLKDELGLQKINEIQSYFEEENINAIITVIKTKNGYHLITSPFRLDVFKQRFQDIDVHKDNPTVLYIP